MQLRFVTGTHLHHSKTCSVLQFHMVHIKVGAGTEVAAVGGAEGAGASTCCADVPCHANMMLQRGRGVRSNNVCSLVRPATKAASVGLVGCINRLLLRQPTSRRNTFVYDNSRVASKRTRQMRLILTLASSQRTCAQTKLKISDAMGSSRSWKAGI